MILTFMGIMQDSISYFSNYLTDHYDILEHQISKFNTTDYTILFFSLLLVPFFIKFIPKMRKLLWVSVLFQVFGYLISCLVSYLTSWIFTYLIFHFVFLFDLTFKNNFNVDFLTFRDIYENKIGNLITLYLNVDFHTFELAYKRQIQKLVRLYLHVIFTRLIDSFWDYLIDVDRCLITMILNFTPQRSLFNFQLKCTNCNSDYILDFKNRNSNSSDSNGNINEEDDQDKINIATCKKCKAKLCPRCFMKTYTSQINNKTLKCFNCPCDLDVEIIDLTKLTERDFMELGFKIIYYIIVFISASAFN